MMGGGLQFRGNRAYGGDDRIYKPVKACNFRNHQHQQQQNDKELRRAKSDLTTTTTTTTTTCCKDDDDEKSWKKVALPPRSLCNLERFLSSVAPSVPAQYLSKTATRGLKTCDMEFQPYFDLGDLWESFKERSVYGAGVPIVLNGCDSIVQYYVPYLSAIQIYVDSSDSSLRSRRPGEDSDSDYFRDSSSDGSSDCETEHALRHMTEQQRHWRSTNDVSFGMDRLSLRSQHSSLRGDSSSDEGESANSLGSLLCEYFERDPPFSRVPLADKMSDLASRYPELETLRSCEVLPSSWLSVAWYPIYRIPTGPTLKDLSACFLTFHSLHTPLTGSQNALVPSVTYPKDVGDVPRISLPHFGLATYKFKGSLWVPDQTTEHKLVNAPTQAANEWLQLHQVNHPDFHFFCGR